LSSRRPDEQYAEEIAAIENAGFTLSLFSLEAFESGEFRATPPLPPGAEILYRGWMLSTEKYSSWVDAIKASGATPFTHLSYYLASHHLPNWYPSIADLTPETRIFAPESDLAAELRALGWREFFIKDFVKSLKTVGGSKISNLEQLPELIAHMRQFRGSIEGGFCVRRFEEFRPETEKRYFVINGTPYAESGTIPEIVLEASRRLRSRFYSVDIIQRADGVLRIVEVGDGQVSDLVGWTPQRFAAVLHQSFAAGS
jgi:hypothetical protein